MAYYTLPTGDLNAKYSTANAELNQLYSLATSALPVAPDAVIQALITCRMSLTGLMPGQTQPNPVPAPYAAAPAPAAAPAAPAAPVYAPPPEPDPAPLMAPPPPNATPAMYPPPAQPDPSMYPPPAQPDPSMYPPPAQPGMYPPPAAMSGHVQAGGPPPPPPAVLMPQGSYQPRVAPPPEQANFDRREDGWPPRSYHKSLGEAIYQAQETQGNVRHEIIIEKRVIGRILGKGGRDLAAMKESSGAEVFIIDKEPPPGVDEDHRLLILIGTPDCVNACLITVNKTLERARNELPPLPPPLSSGWRPVPSVGSDSGWTQHGNERKRPHDY